MVPVDVLISTNDDASVWEAREDRLAGIEVTATGRRGGALHESAGESLHCHC